MYILGVHYGHDASAALVKDGEIIAVIQEERRSRIKHQHGFPFLAIKSVLEKGGIIAADVDCVAISGNDRRKESVRELLFALKGRKFYSYTGYMRRIRTVIADNTKNYRGLLRNLADLGLKDKKRVYFEHHLCHASNAYRTSGLDKALVVTVDGVGDDVSASVNIAEDGVIKRIAETRPEHSLGFLYQAVTESLGFVPVEGEYKTMGFAAFGDRSGLLDYFMDIVKCEGLGFRSKYIWESEWRFPAPTISQHTIFKDLQKDHKREDIAAACQGACEEVMAQFVGNATRETGLSGVCASGGVFLNVKANKLIREKLDLDDFYVFPDSGDAGLALGAALELDFRLNGWRQTKRIEHVYYGTEYDDVSILEELKNHNVRFFRTDDICGQTAKLLDAGRVIGWFQGRMEMGPRALGNRSVLADPRKNEMKEKINKHLKKREWFVPFAPSVIEEDAGIFVDGLKEDAPFMLMAYDAKEGISDRVPAVVHVDGTLRPQLVKRNINPRYWELINNFKAITGVGLLINTSFNKHGLPVVESPRDAVEHLINGNVDILAMGDYIVERAG